MRIAIVVEGESDKVIVESVLRSVVSDPPFEVAQAGGRSSAVSLARSYFTLPDSHVALLVDADTVDSRQVLEQQRILSDSLAAVAPTWGFAVFLAVPEIESCLFADPKLLTGALGTPMTDEMLLQARFQPRVVLGNLLCAAKLNGDYAAAIGQILAKPDSLSCSPGAVH